MDFSYTEEQEAVRELARQILADRTSHERSKQLETSGVFYDDELWNELVQANLVALAVPETHGGGGLGITEVCILLEEAGRHVAPVPLLPTVVLGALPIAEFGSDAQKQRWLTPVSESGAILTAALDENGSSDAARPRVTARRDGDGWRLDGEKVCVPAGHRASAILVPASIDGGVGVFLLEPQAEGVKLERQIATHHEPQALMQLSGARVDAEGLLGDPARGREIVEWIVDRALLGYASMQLGSCQAALHATAEYLRERKQFGKPIGSFQAAQMRAADAYIDVESMRSVLMEAIWRLDAGLRARAEIVAAKWWAARGGDRVVHTAQHLHGGIGSDVDYPIHRYFLWSQYLGTVLGGGNRQLAHLGKLLVSDDERPAL